MGNTVYLECNMGISGDMTVAALLDLGADEEVLKRALDSMPLSGFAIEISRVKKAGLDVCDFAVKLDGKHENHDHDMEYLHGHEHHHRYGKEDDVELHHGHSHSAEHSQQHQHSEEHQHFKENQRSEEYQHSKENQRSEEYQHSKEHQHSEEHQHSHEHHHSHEHRGLPEIQKIIRHTNMSERAKEVANHIFDILARAEAKAHGVDRNAVHFHEVGAVDSIVDIVAAAVCLDNLDVTEVIVPCLCEGKGTVRCQHGILPIPVPAVANIVQMYELPLRVTEMQGELVTPTGAAIVAAVRTTGTLPEQFTVQKIGMGGGKRSYERPSILRAMLIQAGTEQREEEVYKLETNIDDCTGEMLGYVMERLFENGAADVHYTPVFMKKNRPAYLLTVLCARENVSTLERIIFKETTTIGIRKVRMERHILGREMETVHLPMGEIQVKKCVLPDGTIRRYPEYETVAKLAEETGKSMQEILAAYQRE